MVFLLGAWIILADSFMMQDMFPHLYYFLWLFSENFLFLYAIKKFIITVGKQFPWRSYTRVIKKKLVSIYKNPEKDKHYVLWQVIEEKNGGIFCWKFQFSWKWIIEHYYKLSYSIRLDKYMSGFLLRNPWHSHFFSSMLWLTVLKSWLFWVVPI